MKVKPVWSVETWFVSIDVRRDVATANFEHNPKFLKIKLTHKKPPFLKKTFFPPQDLEEKNKFSLFPRGRLRTLQSTLQAFFAWKGSLLLNLTVYEGTTRNKGEASEFNSAGQQTTGGQTSVGQQTTGRLDCAGQQTTGT